MSKGTNSISRNRLANTNIGHNDSEIRVRSPWEMAWHRLRQHRLAMTAMMVLLVLHFLAIFADFFGPYGQTETNRDKFYHPPTRIHFFDEQGRLVRPYVYNYKLVRKGTRRYQEDTSKKYPIHFFVRGQEYRFLWLVPTTIRLFGVEKPAEVYLLGTDQFGRDIFSRLLHGGRKSLFIGVVGISISTVIGLIYGGISGYFGGVVDNIMMRIAEIVISIPSFYLLLALSAVLPMGISSSLRFFLISIILAFIGWASMARVIRGMVLSIKEREFVEGARSVGCSTLRIITKHILPNTFSYVIVAATLSLPGFILSESALSLIGVGIQEPEASWGNMLRAAMNVVAMTQYPWILVPGFVIFITVLSYSFFGDGVRDALDPRISR